jgi:hypothetical protein
MKLARKNPMLNAHYGNIWLETSLVGKVISNQTGHIEMSHSVHHKIQQLKL